METRVKILILTTLTAFLHADAGCLFSCPNAEDFEVTRGVPQSLAGEITENPSPEQCEMVCTDVLRADYTYMSIKKFDSCSLSFHPEFLESNGEETSTTDDSSGSGTDTDGNSVEVGTVQCAGRGVPECIGGRRPLGHVELAENSCSLADHLAGCAHLEAASVIAFEQLAEQLESWGAPPELRARCLAAAEDERVHARLVGSLARAAGASITRPEQRPHADDLRSAALHNAVEGCVHETWAALLAGWSARRAETDALRQLHARLARDELEHAELAWSLAAWFHPRLPAEARAQVEHALVATLTRLPELARAQARRFPAALGLPSPDALAAVAESLAERLTAAVDELRAGARTAAEARDLDGLARLELR